LTSMSEEVRIALLHWMISKRWSSNNVFVSVETNAVSDTSSSDKELPTGDASGVRKPALMLEDGVVGDAQRIPMLSAKENSDPKFDARRHRPRIHVKGVSSSRLGNNCNYRARIEVNCLYMETRSRANLEDAISDYILLTNIVQTFLSSKAPGATDKERMKKAIETCLHEAGTTTEIVGMRCRANIRYNLFGHRGGKNSTLQKDVISSPLSSEIDEVLNWHERLFKARREGWRSLRQLLVTTGYFERSNLPEDALQRADMSHRVREERRQNACVAALERAVMSEARRTQMNQLRQQIDEVEARLDWCRKPNRTIAELLQGPPM